MVMYAGLFMALVVASAGCGGASRSSVDAPAPAEGGGSADDGLLRASLLRSSDFPKDWKRVPFPVLDRCARTVMPDATAFARSSLFKSLVSNGAVAAAGQAAWMFANSRAAAKAYARSTSAGGDACLQESVVAQLEQQSLTVGTSIDKAVRSTTKTSRAISYILRVSSPFGSGDAYAQLIQRHRGRAVTVLVVVSVYSPVSPDSLHRLSGLVAKRLASGV
jgi:hypothetical protein